MLIGLAGLVFLVMSFVVDDIFGDLLDFGDGYVSGPAVATFLTAFGFAGALADAGEWGTVPAVGVGLGAGVLFGALAAVATRAFMHMRTDATPATSHLTGLEGIVVTPIPQDGVGEVSVKVGGVPAKISARSSSPLATGTQVTIVQAVSPTSVIVEPQGPSEPRAGTT